MARFWVRCTTIVDVKPIRGLVQVDPSRKENASEAASRLCRADPLTRVVGRVTGASHYSKIVAER